MFIDQVLSTIRPLYEAESVNSLKCSNDTKNALKNLSDYLYDVYKNGGSWSRNNISPTASEVAELYDVYKYIVHDHVDIKDITTIRQAVHDLLVYFGFKLKNKGVGWNLTEADDNASYKLTYKVTGIYDVYARTEEEAEMNIQDEDFGDLYEPTWSKEDVEFTMDGKRNDLVHVTYEVTGTEPVFVKAESVEDAKRSAEQILSAEDFGPLDYLEFECFNVEEPKAMKEDKRDKIPSWAKEILDNQVCYGEVLDVYNAGDMTEVTVKESGDVMTFRIYKNGTITER